MSISNSKLVALCIALCVYLNLSAATITSSASGDWSAAGTWLGGVVPSAGDDVVINSAVYVNGDVSCKDLTINAAAALYNQYAYSITLTATGNVLNNGSILNNPSGYSFSLSLQGNIVNNGAWKVNLTTLSGSSDQMISEGAGFKFEGPISLTDSIGAVVLGSDVLVNANSWNLNRATLKTNGFKLLTTNYTLRNGYVQSNDLLDLSETIIAQLNFSGNFTLKGKIYSQSDNVFNGTVTIADTLLNQYAFSNTLAIKGKIINNGVIIGNPSGYSLGMDVDGDIQNNGVWRPSATTISGSAHHTIQQTVGKSFESPFTMSDSIGDLILGSDVTFQGSTLALNRATLRTNTFVLTANNHNLRNGSIISNETMVLDNTVIETLQLFGNYAIGGNVYSETGIVFNDNCMILDTLFNRYAYSNTIAVKGNIVNRGTIQYNPSGYSLTLDVAGNLTNEGIWNPTTTNLNGTLGQTLQQSSGKRFQGTFNTTDSIGDMTLGSDVLMQSNTWNLNRAKILTNGHKLLTNSATLSDGKIQSNDSLRLQASVIRYMKFFGDYKIGGLFYSQTDNEFNGTCTITDTLYNQYAFSNSIAVKGNLINKGVIQYNPSGYSLTLDVAGNLSNQGIWRPTTTNLVGAEAQSLDQTLGKKFEGTFNTTDSIGDMTLGSDVFMEANTWNLNRAKILTNGHKLLTNNATLSDGKIQSNDTLRLQGSIIRYMKFDGDYKIGGRFYSQTNNEFNGTCTITDTLYNQYAFTNTLVVKGNLINKGRISNHPGGYYFNLNVAGDIRNEGNWSPNSTNLTGATDQNVQQGAGKRFEGAINTTDSVGDVVLGTDIALESNGWNFNNAKLLTNGHNLYSNNYTLRDVKVYSNDTLNLNNSYLINNRYFGNYKLNGNIYSQSGNVFNDTATVLDTLANQYAHSNTLVVNGNLVNKGYIINHPSGYSFSLQLKGSLTNNQLYAPSNSYLVGTNPRTISSSNPNNIGGNFYLDDTIHFSGNNTLPNLAFTAKPATYCVVDSAASLSLPNASNLGKLLNNGKLTITQPIDNTLQNTLSFYDASMRCKAGVAMNKLTIDHFGNQQHPTTTGAVNAWWRVRNYPQNFTDSLDYLKLNYKTEALNGNLEDSLHVYYSANAGLSWARIKKGVTLDKVNKAVQIAYAPASGHYILATSTDGISTFRPSMESAEPRFGGNSGQVTLYLYGAGFKSTSKAFLRFNQNEFASDTAMVTDATGESMLARFNLKGRSIGAYDVIVKTPGDSTLVLPAYFSVLQGERSAPWVALTGRDRFLLNRTQTFNLNYGNSANVDAKGTILVFAVNDLPGLEVNFPDTKVVLPKAIIAMGPEYTRIADSVALYYTTDTLTGYEGKRMRVYPFYMPIIAAGSSRNMRVQVKLTGTGTLNMTSWTVDPLYETIDRSRVKTASGEPMPTEVRACVTAAAMKYFFKTAVTMIPIPGAGCYGLVDKWVEPFDTPGETVVQSTFWNCVSWASNITQCAVSLTPGLGQAVQLGTGIVGLMIDAKENKGADEDCWRKFKMKSESKRDSKGVSSFDPNEIVGPQGFGADHYISEEGNLNYRIYFENKKTAGASALEVFVKDTIDVNQFDLKTFSFKTITFADTTVNIQDYAKEFTILVDRFPKKEIIVQVHGVVDTITGEIAWDFHSLDRVTLELTEDPDLGFLSPNIVSPEGEGNVAFSCKLKSSVPHNTVITNKATIVFDFNPPLTTNLWSNKIDAMPPTSSINLLGSSQSDSTFTVSWTANDSGAGITNCKVFVSKDDSAFSLCKTAYGVNAFEFTGRRGSNYKFYTIATDSIGFSEAQKTSYEAITNISMDVPILNVPAQFEIYPNPASTHLTLNVGTAFSNDLMLKIYSLDGKLIRNQKLLQSIQTLNVSDLSPGVYLVELKSEAWSEKKRLVIGR